MIAWLALLPLRLKIYGAIALAGLLALGGLWVAWRMASAKASRASQRADALAAARRSEKRIAERISRVRAREREWREELDARKRDHFEQGYGP